MTEEISFGQIVPLYDDWREPDAAYLILPDKSNEAFIARLRRDQAAKTLLPRL